MSVDPLLNMSLHHCDQLMICVLCGAFLETRFGLHSVLSKQEFRASLTFNTMNLFHTAPHLISLCSNNNVFCISCQVLTTLRSAVNWENNKRTKSLNHATPSAALCRELLADVSVDFQTIATERIRVLTGASGNWTLLCVADGNLLLHLYRLQDKNPKHLKH